MEYRLGVGIGVSSALAVSYLITGIIGACAMGAIVMTILFFKHKIHDDFQIVGIIRREEDERLKGYKIARLTKIAEKGIDLLAEIEHAVNNAVLVAGMAGVGKSLLLSILLWRTSLQKRVVIFSLKTFPAWVEEDFVNIPHFIKIDMTQYLPTNIFNNADRFASSYALALLSSLTMKGMMYNSVRNQIRNLITDEVRSWNDLKRKIEKVKRERNTTFDTSVLNSISDSIEQFKRFGGRQQDLHIDWKNATSNYVLSFSEFGDDNEALKIFYCEYILRDVFSRQLGYALCIDEAHMILKNTGSIVGTILRTGRVSTDLFVGTQNYSDIAREHLQFGSVFLHYTINKDDIDAIHDDFVKDAVRQLRGHQFVSLTAKHDNDKIMVYQADQTNFRKVVAEWKETKKEEAFVPEVVPIVEEETGKDEEKGEQIIYILRQSSVPLYGYEIGKSCGLPPKEAGLKVKQPLRILEKEGQVKIWKCQIRNKEVPYYYLKNDNGRDPCHVLMMRESKKHFGDWKIEFEATHGTQGADFILEKEGKKLAVECETGLKNDIADLHDRIAKNQVENIPTIIVVPTNEKKIFYQHLFDCRACLIAEIEEALRN